ncbi:aminoglycoside phosphotransferase family protein [uncultured Deinococcus sp.]|uniref:phosphotransferase enzyme family protein n=1 Tax=uncultured Deinococcus sp. TaxID=158789 RepID=UPI0025EDF089|nr:aminoglycoside phosphotransferase family protein [uncultured Deinococcus sp.]
MSAPPDLDPAALLAVLRADFGLEVDDVTFLPDGTAHAFRAQGPGGRFFVKVMPDSPYGARVTARALAEVPLLSALRSSGVLPRVPAALRTREGGWVAALGGFRVFVYEWIHGVNTGGAWEAALPELAELLGRLHGASDGLRREVPDLPMPPEDFALPFEAALRDVIGSLPHRTAEARPEVQALRDLLGPHLGTLERVLDAVSAVAADLRSRPLELVVCHTDAHGGNVMRGADGALWIVDWETARLAPPEHDLWMLGRHLPACVDAYARGLGRPFSPDADLLRFYTLRRPLEDLAEDVRWLLRERPTPDVAAHSLRIIGEFVLPALLAAEASASAVHSRWNEP